MIKSLCILFFLCSLPSADPSVYAIRKLPQGMTIKVDGDVSEWNESFFIDSLRSEDNVFYSSKTTPWSPSDFQFKLYLAYSSMPTSNGIDTGYLYGMAVVTTDSDYIIRTTGWAGSGDNMKINPGGQAQAFYISTDGSAPILNPSSPYVTNRTLFAQCKPYGNASAKLPTYEWAMRLDVDINPSRAPFQATFGSEEIDSGGKVTCCAVGVEYTGFKTNYYTGTPVNSLPQYYPTFVFSQETGSLYRHEPITAFNYISPTLNSRPKFIWNKHDSITNYKLTVDTLPSFGSPLILTQTTDTFFQTINNLPCGTIYWKIEDFNSNKYTSQTYKFIIKDTLQSSVSLSSQNINFVTKEPVSLPLTICNTTGRKDLSYSFYSQKDDTIRILLWTYYTSSTSISIINTKAWLNNSVPRPIIKTFSEYDSSLFRKALTDVDVLVMLCDKHLYASSFYGFYLNKVLDDFTKRGGTIVCCNPYGFKEFLQNANIINVATSSFAPNVNPILIKKTSNRLFSNVNNLFTTQNSYRFSLSDSDTQNILATDSEYCIIAEKSVNKGRLFLFGNDYSTLNSDWGQLLKNTIRPSTSILPKWLTIQHDSGNIGIGNCQQISIAIDTSLITPLSFSTELSLWHNSLDVQNPISIQCNLPFLSKTPVLKKLTNRVSQKTNPLLKWNSVDAYAYYQIQLDTNKLFISNLVSQLTTDSFLLPAIKLPAGKIYWRVKSNMSPVVSKVDSFIILNDSIPELIPIFPDTIINRRPTFTWFSAPGIKTYQLIVVPFSEMSYWPWFSVPVADTFYTMPIDLPYSKTYWKVCLPNDNYYRYCGTIDTFWVITPDAVEKQNDISAIFALKEATPNPFNPSTVIRFSVPESKNTTITIFDTKGRNLRTLVNGTVHKGQHSIEFNGKDNGGNNLSSGIYICRMESGSFNHKIKIVMVR